MSEALLQTNPHPNPPPDLGEGNEFAVNLPQEILQELNQLSRRDDQIEEAWGAVIKELEGRKKSRGIDFYTPHAKQLEFHRAGRDFPERAFCAGNRLGKTEGGCAEDTYHLTGLYPKWWEGKRFHKPVELLLIGNYMRQLRAAAQQKLFGPPNNWGTGLIPKEDIVDVKTIHGISGSIDYALIKHYPGTRANGPDGESGIYLCSAEQGWQAQQGRKLDIVHEDEEPPASTSMDIYAELVMRLIDSNGIFYITATPQQGMTDLMGMFWGDIDPENPESQMLLEGMKYRKLIRMEVNEATHLTPQQIERMKASIPPHQWAMRLRGLPEIGQGRVWDFDEDQIKFTDLWDERRRRHCQYIIGMDSGFANSYTALVLLAYDKVEDRYYIVDCKKMRRTYAAEIAADIQDWYNRFGFAIPVAWPRDVGQEKGGAAGTVLKEQFEDLGVNMLENSAQFEDENKHRVEPGLHLVRTLMHEDKAKVYYGSRMEPWWKEWQLFSYGDDGKVIKTRNRQNDLMDATRYGFVMLSQGYGDSNREGRRSEVPMVIPRRGRFGRN